MPEAGARVRTRLARGPVISDSFASGAGDEANMIVVVPDPVEVPSARATRTLSSMLSGLSILAKLTTSLVGRSVPSARKPAAARSLIWSLSPRKRANWLAAVCCSSESHAPSSCTVG
ncbi:Uncharacterised protein [Mycobacteroides abscessus subsp. abscessus]|nr:Uncharacterised protein [Mycobacteroides abscessus subsp. abscessus]